MPPRKPTDFIICDTCTHTENIHEKYDGRSPRHERSCGAYECKCTKFIERTSR